MEALATSPAPPPAPPAPDIARAHEAKVVPLVISAAAAVVLWWLPLGLEPNVQHALAIAAFMVLAWITHAVDHAVAGFIGCYAFWASYGCFTARDMLKVGAALTIVESLILLFLVPLYWPLIGI